MALGTTHSILKSQTVLQQLLEEINFQRTKEMRQLLKDDSGFVVLQGTTYWTDLFVRHFLFQSEPDHSIDSDDLLFFVRKKHVKGTSRHMPKYETEVDVFRKDSRKLPIGDPDVDWEETVYLNLIIHQFNYTLTLAICTRTSPKELQVLRRHSQRVYASPSRRKMDTKGDGEEMTYPHICFMVDNFDEVFSDIMVRDGEMVCVELVASDRDGSVQGVIFLGSIRYDALKKVYDARQSSLSSKVAQRMTFGLFSSSGPQTRCEFVRMKGPQGKGHAEMAVTKPKGSGVETPTSEPGFCATDMWDEWDEDPDEYYNYRHQRRLSDPSANLNNYSRYGWKSKAAGGGDGSAGTKARSENEGLDSLASELSEIEAGDLKDDRPASSVAAAPSVLNPTPSTDKLTKLAAVGANGDNGGISSTIVTTPPTTCCGKNCFSSRKRWTDTASGQMSDVYCRSCDGLDKSDERATKIVSDDDKNDDVSSIDDLDSPACLASITPKHRRVGAGGRRTKTPRNLLTVESELEIPNGNKDLLKKDNKKSSSTQQKRDAINANKKKSPKLVKKNTKVTSSPKLPEKCLNGKNNNKKIEEYEYADDATAYDGDAMPTDKCKMGILNEMQSKLMIRVQGKEELPATQTTNSSDGNNKKYPSIIDNISSNISCDINSSDNRKVERDIVIVHNKATVISSLQPQRETDTKELFKKLPPLPVFTLDNDHNGNDGSQDNRLNRNYSTLPKMKRNSQQQHLASDRPLRKIPMRTTPDGTNIYYWCDLSKKALKELDDGAYNPLWATRGFTQTFHFWKEHRRQQSTPLNAFLTYVTLPWWSIAKDLLDHRETPILTF